MSWKLPEKPVRPRAVWTQQSAGVRGLSWPCPPLIPATVPLSRAGAGGGGGLGMVGPDDLP